MKLYLQKKALGTQISLPNHALDQQLLAEVYMYMCWGQEGCPLIDCSAAQGKLTSCCSTLCFKISYNFYTLPLWLGLSTTLLSAWECKTCISGFSLILSNMMISWKLLKSAYICSNFLFFLQEKASLPSPLDNELTYCYILSKSSGKDLESKVYLAFKAASFPVFEPE